MPKTSLLDGIVGIAALAVLLSATVSPVAAGNSCGHLNTPCCSEDTCDPGLVCAEDCAGGGDGLGAGAFVCEPTCIPCGGAGQPCCEQGVCNSGFTCDDFFANGQSAETGSGAITAPAQCVPCGDPGQPCCDLDVCNEGAFCETCDVDALAGDGGGATIDCNLEAAGGGAQLMRGPNLCVGCGDPGQPCCPGDMCDTNALCDAGLCEACGQVGEQCCAEATCPNSNAVCEEDVCEPLPSVPAMGWMAMLSLVGLLVGVGSLTLPRRRS